MQAPHDGAGGAAGGAGGHGGRGNPYERGVPGGPAGQRGVRGGGGAGAAPLGRGRGGEPAPAARRPRILVHQFTMRVPFLSPMEAEVARRSLAPRVEPHLHAIRKELAVIGSFLVVRWTARDTRLLGLSFTSFLDQLSLVVQNMQRFGPLFPPKSLPGKGG
ncbi:EKC/KEOPS complex subunit LAGE3-like [Camelus ferus]|uniref:L antigen family member 3 n=1 Tax=Camelus ferus TaxID=419612 RepID=A0A8B8SMX9_CAMFR|nr:EKC/KEOPS complex subunit LAGE3-like [Camelus ferus]XP_032331239.1 EKC/KEOPS complex subunit LAGE3-like [Camelus ferus]